MFYLFAAESVCIRVLAIHVVMTGRGLKWGCLNRLNLLWFMVKIRYVQYFKKKFMGPSFLPFCASFDLLYFPEFYIFQLLYFFILNLGLLLFDTLY